MGRKKRTGGDAAAEEAAAAAAVAGQPSDVAPAGGGQEAPAAGAAPAAEAGAGAAAAPLGSLTSLTEMLKANPALALQVAANPLLASRMLQHAQAFTHTPVQTINPDVQDLADHFGLDERITKQLNDEMVKRKDTHDGDMHALWDILETARVPAGLLSVKIKEMQNGVFVGQPKIDKDVKEMQKMYNLDDQATRKLAEVLHGRAATRKDDVEQLHRHLETSNKPSSRVMMMLGKLRSGESLGEPDKRVAPGSWLDRQEREKEREKERRDKDRDRGRSRDRAPKRAGSRSRERKRSRTRSRRR